ncbi:MAG: ABC transporter substrate-binding protein [Deltaproteobacteria bacterium]|jgi:peptide/nickel transport system substrate-binding protein|nr:ABC transporter substrate-binding protein [Deltaproteobacteria bacterium]
MKGIKPPSGAVFSAIEAELPKLPKKLRAFGRHVLDNRERVIFQTIRQLASEAQVSESTIMRFADLLGFTGYSDFQAAARDYVTGALASTQTKGPTKPPNSLENLSAELNENAVFLELVAHLASARKVHLLSSPDAAADAKRLKWALSRLRPGVERGNELPSLAEEELEALPPDSLVLVMTVWHTTLELMALAERVKDKKIPQYLMTFNQASALGEFCDRRLILDDFPDYPGLALTAAINKLTERTRLALGQRHQDYRESLDLIALNHQPLSERRDTLQLAVGHEIRALDPYFNHSLMREAMVMRCVFQGLVRFREGSWEVVPELAESWQIAEDGRSFVFYLRPGVHFHHGFGEFTAKDVKFSFERLTDPVVLKRQPAWEDLEEAIILSRYAVKLVFRNPCPHLFTSVLPMTSGLIVSQKAIDQMGHSQYSINPVGTGPYAVTSFRPRETLEMKSFDDYWGPAPSTDRLVFRLDVHAFNFPYHFKKGRLDAAVFANVSPRLSQDVSGLKVDNRKALQFWWLGLSVDKPPFDRLEVRQAVRLALDKTKIVESGLPGTEPLHTVIPNGTPGHWAEAPVFPYAPQEARDLMAKVGVPRGTSIRLGADPSEIDFAVLEIVRANLVDIGFDVQFEMSNRKLLMEKISRRQCDMYIFFYNAYQDAYLSLRWFVKDQQYNFSHWDNPAYDELVTLIGRETDAAKRLQMVIEAQRIIIDDAWAIWLAQGHNSLLYNDYVDIGKPLPDGFLTPWTMRKKI